MVNLEQVETRVAYDAGAFPQNNIVVHHGTTEAEQLAASIRDGGNRETPAAHVVFLPGVELGGTNGS